ncbi:glycosyl hydrolase family 28 protein [Streptomyces sp. RKAG337]|uniref:glycosyl hydrolase family 28 protein n=1 Tax=Streptomyces sp. RKAG337 TaxID=2893404 RepID=UPI002033BD30|nr:glycosyl hydrolase family 28 protein [Streptomyces sp. RKAG337]MCM2424371.1 glycosyl hydrolase family 28 protein [Streptomyces sp. RKAG337]
MKRIAVLVGLALFVFLGLAQAPAMGSPAGAAPGSAPGTAARVAAEFNVRDYGATGNGSTNDTAAVNKAITAANAAGGGTVRFPSGNYKSANSIHLKSNVTLQLDSGATLTGSSAGTYDAAESNPYDGYQDFGHSHFHDAMIWGDRLTNIGFTGSGTIDGGGNLITGNPKAGEADKIVSLTRCNGLTLSGITLRRGGHFAALINGCSNVTSDRLTIDTASDRDGWNIISTTNAVITHADIAANDDALVFKSDYALGAKLPNGHVVVQDSHLSARCCNALMFGSETCGDFTDYRFQAIAITGADKSGLGMVSMDGADISDVHYRDITMTGVRSPIMQKIGTRKRCGNSPGVGHISDITYDNITATGASSAFSPTLWGESGGNHIDGVTFTNVNITVPGGSGTTAVTVPSNNPTDYNPNSIGTRPAYGWYLHNADHITFTDSSVRFAANDGRPAVLANTGSTVRFDHFTAQRGTNSPYDLGFQSLTGYCVADSANTTGGVLRVNATGSTTGCAPPTAARYEAEDGSYSAGGTVDTDHTGYSGTGFVNSANAAGAYVQWTVNSAQAGTADITLGYANGTTADRPMDLIVNGAAVPAGTVFGGTGSWNTWHTAVVAVPLRAGANTIRATATTAAGCPNLDYLDGPV